MQAIILATGETKKLSPLTADLPSPMLPIANRPVMSLAVELLARQGIQEIAVTLYEQGGRIESYFATGSRWGVKLLYLLQQEAWGSAGALKWAAGTLRETAVCLPGDAIIDVDLGLVEQFHIAHKQPITAIMFAAAETAKSPTAWLLEDGRLSLDSTAGIPCLFTGAYLINPDLLTAVPARTHFEIDSDLIPKLIAGGSSVYGYQMKGYWNPLETYSQLQAAQNIFLQSVTKAQQNNTTITGAELANGSTRLMRHPVAESVQMSAGVWVGKKNMIHPTVRIKPPVYIGDDCRIGHNVELGPNTIIGSHVIIDNEATVCDSAVFAHSYVGQLVEVKQRIVNKTLLIDIESEKCTEVTDAFLLSAASPSYAGDLVRRNIESLSVFLLLLVTLPLLALLSLILRLTCAHPFQKLAVVGLRPLATGTSAGARQFDLWRFNTRQADGSHTRAGRLLEWLQLHRLPELWNVFRGDMSLVGVKPITPNEAAQITESWQEQRFRYPAGFTGLWYIQMTSQSSLDDSFIADSYYVATRSWREDLRIIKRTVAVWLRRLIKIYSPHYTVNKVF